jgi:hypothetical protein
MGQIVIIIYKATSNSQGDIALDDISLSPACFGKLNCFHHVLHFKWEFHKCLHACILPYRGSQIIVTVILFMPLISMETSKNL